MFFKKNQTSATTPAPLPICGVNLGGWLVLEKWITPGLFKGFSAVDEYSLCESANPGVRGMLRKHRDNFITKQDFVWLKRHGVTAVRLPVGYWVFGDEPPFFGTVDYVDKAFAWAKETGLKILLDLHGAPGSQNGWDHSGRVGPVGWHKDERNIVKTLSVIGRLAERYGKHSQLLGISLLNEPKWTVPLRAQLRYCQAAYKLIRQHCGPKAWVVFSDSFRPRRWRHQLRAPQYQNVYLDTHHYQTFTPWDKRLDVAGHIAKTLAYLPRRLAKMRRYHPVIVGEWSLALDGPTFQGMSQPQIDLARQSYAAAQLAAYYQTSAWFFWTYRTQQGGAWSFRDCVEHGWLRLPGHTPIEVHKESKATESAVF